jgi:hypothetical protein
MTNMEGHTGAWHFWLVIDDHQIYWTVRGVFWPAKDLKKNQDVAVSPSATPSIQAICGSPFGADPQKILSFRYISLIVMGLTTGSQEEEIEPAYEFSRQKGCSYLEGMVAGIWPFVIECEWIGKAKVVFWRDLFALNKLYSSKNYTFAQNIDTTMIMKPTTPLLYQLCSMCVKTPLEVRYNVCQRRCHYPVVNPKEIF